ncbi:MAG: Na+/H+ antiporter subunit E [Nitrosomonas sp.]|nr:Na+/H+ antiporter subunit E [Nitrosomonas sp.]
MQNITQTTFSMIIRASLFSGIWWLLTDGNLTAWWLGGLFVLTSTLLSWRLLPPSSWSLAGWLRFFPYFIFHSVSSSFDVAYRALRPGLNLAPVLIRYPMRLPAGPSHIFMTSITSLLPGTLAADLDGSCLIVHVLDGRTPYWQSLQLLESHIARLTNLALPTPDKQKIPT